MRKVRLLLMPLILLFFFSCKEECEKKGTGTLSVTNTSQATTQRVVVDGIEYGILAPGESLEVDLPVGTYPLLIEGINGGPGCTLGTSNVPIIMCETLAVECNS